MAARLPAVEGRRRTAARPSAAHLAIRQIGAGVGLQVAVLAMVGQVSGRSEKMTGIGMPPPELRVEPRPVGDLDQPAAEQHQDRMTCLGDQLEVVGNDREGQILDA